MSRNPRLTVLFFKDSILNFFWLRIYDFNNPLLLVIPTANNPINICLYCCNLSHGFLFCLNILIKKKIKTTPLGLCGFDFSHIFIKLPELETKLTA